jgi:eukaryotic-like serine/threonine-protein kinase
VALEEYLLGRHLWNQRTLRRTRDAIQHFRNALTHDQAYAPAHSALGDAYLWLGEQGGMPQQEGCALALTAIKDALQADESLAEAHVAMGAWQLNCAWNWQEAEREFRRALELNSGSAAVHQYYGRALSRFTRRFDEAFSELKRARELDPLSPTIRAYLGQGYLFARQYDTAGQQLQEALELNPEHALLLHNLGELSLAQGRWNDAVTNLERSLQRPGDKSSHYLAMLGAAYARAGRHNEARTILEELNRRASDGLVSDFDMAAFHVALGDGDRSLTLLERGYARRDYWLPEMAAWPWFDSLRTNSRYQALLRKMNLPWGSRNGVSFHESPRGGLHQTPTTALPISGPSLSRTR